jgi:hypothetical protein
MALLRTELECVQYVRLIRMDELYLLLQAAAFLAVSELEKLIAKELVSQILTMDDDVFLEKYPQPCNYATSM